MSDFNNNANVARPGRVTANRDLVIAPVLWKWAAQGKVFEAGLDLEDSAIAGKASVDDTTPDIALVAPSSSTTLVIPIMLKVSIHADGSALTQLSVQFTKSAGQCDTTLAVTGTAMTSQSCMYRANPEKAQASSSYIYTCTSSALTTDDCVEYSRKIAIDAMLTTGLVNFGNGPSNEQTFSFLDDGAPHILTSGAAMLVWVVNSTTDVTFKPYMQWAEVEIDDLL